MKRANGLLTSRWTPVVLGVASALIIGWIWGSLDPIPTIHDEAAYLLQARLFAHGRWAGSPPPLPEFFEQLYVLVTPVVASKYPPGTSLLLVPGVLLGIPAAVPLLLTSLAGSLTFALARRIANPWVGLLTWALWMIAPANLHYRPHFFSETVTSALWLLGWWALLEWRRNGRWKWLMLLAGCVGWIAVTRPLTGFLYALPVGIAVVSLCWKRRSWGQLAGAAGLVIGILSILPVWNARTTGDWRTMPLDLYNRTYMPNDLPGFNPNFPPPLRQLPPDLARVNALFLEQKRQHTLRNAPRILGQRAQGIAREMWGGALSLSSLFALLGIAGLRAEGRFALGSSVLLLLGYLPHTHVPSWTLYYLEIYPVLAFVTALGYWRFFRVLDRWRRKKRRAVVLPSMAPLATGIAALALFASAFPGIRAFRVDRQEEELLQRSFRTTIAQIPDRRAIVFVRYRPGHYEHRSLVVNDPFFSEARLWIVYDRGAENGRLIERAPDRVAYLYDESHNTLTRLAPGVEAR